jgi:hypothetical protein
MTEWLKDILGINKYAVETIFLNGRHSKTGVLTKRRAMEVLAARKEKWWYAENTIHNVDKGGAE